MRVTKGLQIGAVVVASVLLAAACSSAKKSSTVQPRARPLRRRRQRRRVELQRSCWRRWVDRPRLPAVRHRVLGVLHQLRTEGRQKLSATLKTTNSANNVQTLVANVQALLS